MGQYKPEGLKHLPECLRVVMPMIRRNSKGVARSQVQWYTCVKNVTVKPIILYANYKLFFNFWKIKMPRWLVYAHPMTQQQLPVTRSSHLEMSKKEGKKQTKSHPNHVKYTLIPLVKLKSSGREMCWGSWRSLFSPTDASIKRSKIAAVPEESHLSKMRMHCWLGKLIS